MFYGRVCASFRRLDGKKIAIFFRNSIARGKRHGAKIVCAIPHVNAHHAIGSPLRPAVESRSDVSLAIYRSFSGRNTTDHDRWPSDATYESRRVANPMVAFGSFVVRIVQIRRTATGGRGVGGPEGAHKP